MEKNTLRVLRILVQHGRIDTDEEKNVAILRQSDGREEQLSFEIVTRLYDEKMITGQYAYPYRSYSATEKALYLMSVDW